MRSNRHQRLVLTALLAVLSLAATLGAADASSTSYYNLAGKWNTPGTSLTLSQSERTITWTGGPDNRAWIQTFKGTIGTSERYGPFFSGEFRQDEPGHLPPRYHGTMVARIDDSCHFTFLEIKQVGQTTLSNIEFSKQPCTVTNTPLASLRLVLYKKQFVAPAGNGSCPSTFECVISNGATVTICNKDDFRHDPFAISYPDQFNAGKGKILLKPGQCFSKRFLSNDSSQAVQVKIYDRIHSQERFILTITP